VTSVTLAGSDFVIETHNVIKNFGRFSALGGITLKLRRGEHYVIKGHSGSGKSTLLYLLGGMDKPSSGDILYDGTSIVDLDDDSLARYRNQTVGFVFQFHYLLSSMTCLDNMLLPARVGGCLSPELKTKVLELSKELGITECLNKYPYEVSGGEQQRVSIIRALSLNPPLLLCDEPTGNLDSVNSNKVVSIVTELAKEFKTTLVIVTHEESIFKEFRNQLTLRDGMMI